GIGGEAETGGAAQRHDTCVAVVLDQIGFRRLTRLTEQEAQRFLRVAALDVYVRTGGGVHIGDGEEESDAGIVVQVVVKSLVGFDALRRRRFTDKAPPEPRLDLTGGSTHVARRQIVKNRILSDRTDGVAAFLDVEVSPEENRLTAPAFRVRPARVQE